MESMDSRHKLFLQRNGVDIYNCYFNRDKKRHIEAISFVPLFPLMVAPPTRISSSGPKCSLEPCEEYKKRFDVFYHEYRDDNENSVPVPPDIERSLVEPLEQYSVPLEYICDHGALEFILETGYPYSLESLFYYSKPSEYQIMYIEKLKREGRL